MGCLVTTSRYSLGISTAAFFSASSASLSSLVFVSSSVACCALNFRTSALLVSCSAWSIWSAPSLRVMTSLVSRAVSSVGAM